MPCYYSPSTCSAFLLSFPPYTAPLPHLPSLCPPLTCLVPILLFPSFCFYPMTFLVDITSSPQSPTRLSPLPLPPLLLPKSFSPFHCSPPSPRPHWTPHTLLTPHPLFTPRPTCPAHTAPQFLPLHSIPFLPAPQSSSTFILRPVHSMPLCTPEPRPTFLALPPGSSHSKRTPPPSCLLQKLHSCLYQVSHTIVRHNDKWSNELCVVDVQGYGPPTHVLASAADRPPMVQLIRGNLQYNSY